MSRMQDRLRAENNISASTGDWLAHLDGRNNYSDYPIDVKNDIDSFFKKRREEIS